MVPMADNLIIDEFLVFFNNGHVIIVLEKRPWDDNTRHDRVTIIIERIVDI